MPDVPIFFNHNPGKGLPRLAWENPIVNRVAAKYTPDYQPIFGTTKQEATMQDAFELGMSIKADGCRVSCVEYTRQGDIAQYRIDIVLYVTGDDDVMRTAISRKYVQATNNAEAFRIATEMANGFMGNLSSQP